MEIIVDEEPKWVPLEEHVVPNPDVMFPIVEQTVPLPEIPVEVVNGVENHYEPPPVIKDFEIVTPDGRLPPIGHVGDDLLIYEEIEDFRDKIYRALVWSRMKWLWLKDKVTTNTWYSKIFILICFFCYIGVVISFGGTVQKRQAWLLLTRSSTTYYVMTSFWVFANALLCYIVPYLFMPANFRRSLRISGWLNPVANPKCEIEFLVPRKSYNLWTLFILYHSVFAVAWLLFGLDLYVFLSGWEAYWTVIVLFDCHTLFLFYYMREAGHMWIAVMKVKAKLDLRKLDTQGCAIRPYARVTSRHNLFDTSSEMPRPLLPANGTPRKEDNYDFSQYTLVQIRWWITQEFVVVSDEVVADLMSPSNMGPAYSDKDMLKRGAIHASGKIRHVSHNRHTWKDGYSIYNDSYRYWELVVPQIRTPVATTLN